MSLRVLFLALLLALPVPGNEPAAKARAKRKPKAELSIFAPETRVYQGCHATMSSCYGACPDRRADPRSEPETCDTESVAPVTCYCLFQGTT